jgi:glycosyltransferase involved in cell wall biosynthesis
MTIEAAGPQRPVAGVEPGYWLTVARLLPYKNVDAIVEAFARMPDRSLVVVGTGPDEPALRGRAPGNVRFLGGVDEAGIRWLYANCRGTVAASYEDFGLTPLEAAAFGKGTVAIRFGGYLDTIIDRETGVLVDAPSPAEIAAGIDRLEEDLPEPGALREHAARFDLDAFTARLRELVAA